MNVRAIGCLALFAAAFVAGCKDSSPVSHAPTTILLVSGSNQAANVSTALDSSLVVKVVDGLNKPVSGVALTWTTLGGGALSATSTTTDANGLSSVKWTLAPTAGRQVVTVTSTQITGASVSFVADNGAVITGSVTTTNTLPFGTSFSRVPAAARLSASAGTLVTPPPRTSNRIVVGFKNDVMGVAAAGSAAYRSMTTARATASRIQSRVAALMQGRGLSNARVSPAILAAQLTVDDPSTIDATLRALRADPSVAYAERSQSISIRNGTAHDPATLPWPKNGAPTAAAALAVSTRLPNDTDYFVQSWAANMIDLPKAWAITTGSSAVTVAVIDMGIRFDHPNMAANLTTDGYDFVTPNDFTTPQQICNSTITFTSNTGDGDGPDPDPTDPNDVIFNGTCWVRLTGGDHGLWTAGIIGAAGNQSHKVAGVNWSVKIRPVRVLDITGSGDDFDIAQGILYSAGLPAVGAAGAAVQTTKAPILNLSLGGTGFSQPMATAVAAAIAQGCLVVAAAGNDAIDDAIPTYPAALPGVMAIAAVGMDGALANYSNAGTNISVSAPGGDFRLDDNGGGSVVNLGWNFVTNKASLAFDYGTSAAAPFVSGVAALLLAQTPSLTAAQLRSRIETFATRPAGMSRSDTYGWGIVNAYNALTQTNGAPRSTIVRLVDATTGAIGRTAPADASGAFTFARVTPGTYFVQAGEDESGDAKIGTPGRRFAWAGGFGKPTALTVNANSNGVGIVLGTPTEVEPNDDNAHANVLSVNSYVTGTITPPDVRDVYSVTVATAGTYVFETTGVTGACGWGIELDTFLTVTGSAGNTVGTNDDNNSFTGPECSRVTVALTPGTYFVAVSASSLPGLALHGRYRLEVRSQ